jgi:hypothetical protein
LIAENSIDDATRYIQCDPNGIRILLPPNFKFVANES